MLDFKHGIPNLLLFNVILCNILKHVVPSSHPKMSNFSQPLQWPILNQLSISHTLQLYKVRWSRSTLGVEWEETGRTESDALLDNSFLLLLFAILISIFWIFNGQWCLCNTKLPWFLIQSLTLWNLKK